MAINETVKQLEAARAELDGILQDLAGAVDDATGEIYTYGATAQVIARLDALSGRIAAAHGLSHQPWGELVTEQAIAKLSEMYTAWQRQAVRASCGYGVD